MGNQTGKLRDALQRNDLDVVKKLLAKANPNARDDSKLRPIHHVRSAEALKLLLDAGGEIWATYPMRSDDILPLIHHIELGNVTIVRELLNRNPHQFPRHRGKPPLLHAILHGTSLEMVQLLLELKADLLARDDNKRSIRDFLPGLRNTPNIDQFRPVLDYVDRLLNCEPYVNERLFEAVQLDDEKEVRGLLEIKANPNSLGGVSNAWRPLHMARAPRMVALLLDAKADIEGIGNSYTPLFYHSQLNGQHETVKLLCERRANLEWGARSELGRNTPLVQAVYYCTDIDNVRALVDAKADVQVTNQKGQNLLELDILMKGREDYDYKLSKIREYLRPIIRDALAGHEAKTRAEAAVLRGADPVEILRTAEAKLQTLEQQSTEFAEVATVFQQSLSKNTTLRVIAADKIVNEVLSVRFEAARKRIATTVSTPAETSERWAFCGVSSERMRAMCDKGLLRVDHPLSCGSAAVMNDTIGDPRQGVYLVRQADEAVEQCEDLKQATPTHELKIVMFRVLPGRSRVIEKRTPGLSPTEGYHSHTSATNDTWFLFNEDQCCPAYALTVRAIDDREADKRPTSKMKPHLQKLVAS